MEEARKIQNLLGTKKVKILNCVCSSYKICINYPCQYFPQNKDDVKLLSDNALKLKVVDTELAHTIIEGLRTFDVIRCPFLEYIRFMLIHKGKSVKRPDSTPSRNKYYKLREMSAWS